MACLCGTCSERTCAAANCASGLEEGDLIAGLALCSRLWLCMGSFLGEAGSKSGSMTNRTELECARH
eukprot:193449-Amphidinium_carterae.2